MLEITFNVTRGAYVPLASPLSSSFTLAGPRISGTRVPRNACSCFIFCMLQLTSTPWQAQVAADFCNCTELQNNFQLSYTRYLIFKSN